MRTFLAMLLGLAACTAISLPATAGVAADQNGGYSATVLEKVAPHWRAPADAGKRLVRVYVRIAGDGSVLSCEVTGPSGRNDMDIAACAAVSAAGRMPVPPYGLVSDVHMAFSAGDGGATAAPQMGDTYTSRVMAAIQRHWQPPTTSGVVNVLLRLRLRVLPDGKVTDAAIETSSGQADVDASALRAVAQAGTLPVPPDGLARDMVLTFTLRASGQTW